MSIKLYYFDGCGRAEGIRWILSHAGVDFEDIRAPYSIPATIPPEIKAKCRWGQVPVVEIDGKTLTQSGTIARFFAQKYNLIPEDPFQAALCNEYIDAVGDAGALFWPAFMIQDKKEKEEKVKEAIKTIKSRFLDVFEKIIKDNGGKHLVGDKLTLADICFAQSMDQYQILGVDMTEGYENVRKLKESVMNTPKIKAWVEKRPKTVF